MTADHRRLIKGALIGALCAVAVLVLWVLITGVMAYRAAGQVQESSEAVIANLRSGDTATAKQALATLQDAAETLDARLGSAPWTQLATLPALGPTLRVLTDIADGTAAVADATRGNEDVVVDTIADLREQGASGVGSLTALQPFTATAAGAVAEPARRVAAVPPEDIFGPLRDFTTTRQRQFLGVADGLTAASGATVALPAMMGADKPRTWLVVVQNDAEARGTGGLLSAYGIVAVREGRISPQTADTTNDLWKDEVATVGIPRDTRQLWGADQLARWWGMNLDRNFPYAGLLMHRGSPAPVDDIITIDARVVAGLLEATGPVRAAGVRVSAGEAEEFFTRTIYRRFRDPEQKDAVTVALIRTVLERLATADLDLLELWDVLAEPATEGRLLTYSSDPDVQRALELLPTAGLVPEEWGPWASVAVNDYGGNKMSAFVDVSADFRSAARCPVEGAESALTVTVTNNAPADLPDYVDVRSDKPGAPTGTGTANLSLALYAPRGSAFRAMTLDGVPIERRGGTDRSHPVWKTTVELRRGESRTVQLLVAEPRVAGQPITFSAQPMVNDMTVTTGTVPC